MELLFDHTLGKQEQQDLVICRPMAIVDEDEEAEAIDRGWLALDHPVSDHEVFYQSRSTRIDMDKYRPRYKSHTHNGEQIGVKVIDASEMVKLLSLPYIYKQYMKRKNFGADYDPFGHYHKRDQFMVFYQHSAHIRHHAGPRTGVGQPSFREVLLHGIGIREIVRIQGQLSRI